MTNLIRIKGIKGDLIFRKKLNVILLVYVPKSSTYAKSENSIRGDIPESSNENRQRDRRKERRWREFKVPFKLLWSRKTKNNKPYLKL